MKVKIKNISIADNIKGQPMIDKNGTPYKTAWLDIGDGKNYSMFIGQKYGQKDYEVISTWRAEQEVEIIIEQKGQYFNFKLPNKTDLLEERVEILERQLKTMWAKVKPLVEKPVDTTDIKIEEIF